MSRPGTLGELREITTAEGRRRYDPNAHDRHHHLVCRKCHAILDVPKTAVPDLPDHDRHGYTDLSADVVFYGLCPPCAA